MSVRMSGEYRGGLRMELTHEPSGRAIATAAPETKETLMPTLAEYWKDEGRAEGELKGRAEGELKGRAEGARKVLLSLLELKFGALEPLELARVEAASEEELARWATRVLTAASVSEALAG